MSHAATILAIALLAQPAARDGKAAPSSDREMRQHLRRLIIGISWYSRPTSKFDAVVQKLRDATQLSKLVISHDMICGSCRWGRGGMNKDTLMTYLKPLLMVLHKAQMSGESTQNVLDLIEIKPMDRDVGPRRGCRLGSARITLAQIHVASSLRDHGEPGRERLSAQRAHGDVNAGSACQRP